MAFATVYNVTDSPVAYDAAAHLIGGQEYGTVDPDAPDAADDIAAGRLRIIPDPGGDLSGLSSPMRLAILATRAANGGAPVPAAPAAPVPLLAFAGRWAPDTTFLAGHVVVYNGGLWVALGYTPGTSAFNPASWNALLTAAEVSSGPATVGYDSQGRVNSFARGGLTTIYTYDSTGRVTTESTGPTGGPPTSTLTYHYDSAGKLGSVT